MLWICTTSSPEVDFKPARVIVRAIDMQGYSWILVALWEFDGGSTSESRDYPLVIQRGNGQSQLWENIGLRAMSL